MWPPAPRELAGKEVIRRPPTCALGPNVSRFIETIRDVHDKRAVGSAGTHGGRDHDRGTIRSVLLWSGLINYGILILWVLATLAARKFYHRIASWFGVSAEHFDLLNFVGLMFYKLAIFLFFLVPYLAIRIVG